MNDILIMLLTALGAVASAALILAAVGAVLGAGMAALSVLGSVAMAAAPIVICAGGVAYAASNTGFGDLRG